MSTLASPDALAVAVRVARTQAYQARVQARIGSLLSLAERQAGTTGMTTHEAKDHFRARGARLSAQRLHVLLNLLARQGQRLGAARATVLN